MPSFFPDTFLSSVPRGTSLAGLDIGAKTIGVAVSDTLWLTATPLKTIFRKSFQYDMNELSALLKGREIGVKFFFMVLIREFFSFGQEMLDIIIEDDTFPEIFPIF